MTPHFLTGHDGIRTGSPATASELLDEFLPHVENGLFVSDFDGCLIGNDFGKTCFDHKLHNGEYWKWDVADFEELLLPTTTTEGNLTSYRRLVERATEGVQADETTQKKAQHLMQLYEELVALYTEIHEQEENPTSRDKFAQKMQEFDTVVLSLEGFFSRYFGNQIFSRLRFFAGRSHLDAKSIAIESLQKNPLPLNHNLVETLGHLRDQGAIGRIITTNFISNVRAAIEKIPALHQIFSENDVIATTMQGRRQGAKNPFMMNRSIRGTPVFGSRKAELARQVSINQNRQLVLAAGDSHFGDGPMLAESLAQGGVNIIPVGIGKDVAEVAQEMEIQICAALGLPELTAEIQQRMWYQPLE